MSEINLNKLPPLHREILENFTTPLNPDIDLENVLNVLNVKLAHMITSKRIKVRPLKQEKPTIVNYYALNFISSGGGKDKLVNDIDNYLLDRFKKYFKEKTSVSDEEKQVTKEEIKIEKNKQKQTRKRKEPKDVGENF